MTGALLFLSGILLAVELLACAYRVVDVWYCIDRQIGRIASRALLWCSLLLLLEWELPADHRSALNAGLISFTILHIVIYWIGQLLRILQRNRR